MYDIVFINSIQMSWGHAMMPIGTMSLATVLREKNYNVAVIDFNLLWDKRILHKYNSIEKDLENICKYVLNLDAKIIGFSTMSSSHHTAICVAEKIKKVNKDLKIVFGGPQASLVPRETLEAFPWIDLVSIGEGEGNIEEIVDSLLNNKTLDKINGVAYRKGSNVVVNEKISLITNLDEIPFIDYSFVDIGNEKVVSLDIGRGCPFSCIYCCTKTFWKQKFRLKSTERIIQEIEYIIEKYHKYAFVFQHDLFTLDKQKVINFCDALVRKNIKIRWVCSARVDTLDEELIKTMKQAGCIRMFLGIETGSERMQKILKKNLKLDNIWSVCQILKKHKIEIDASFIYGLPGETVEDLNCTLKMILVGVFNNYWFPQLYLCNVENGTEVYELIKDKLFISKEGSYSELCNEEEFEYFRKVIQGNPNIFPHFYDFEADTRQSFVEMSKFVWVLSSLAILGLATTFKLILEYYNEEIIMFYKDIINIDNQMFKKLYWKDLSLVDAHNYSSVSERLSLMTNFIVNKDFGRFNEVIKDMFKLESTLINFRQANSKADRIEQHYNYDVLTARFKGVTEELLNRLPNKVVFLKDSSNKVKMERTISAIKI